MLWLILIIVLVVLLAASVPAWPYSTGWGYSPAGVVAAILLVLLLLWLTGIIEFNDDGGGTVRAPSIEVTPRSRP